MAAIRSSTKLIGSLIVEENELFYMFDQRLRLGLRRKLVGGLSLDFNAGYVFDREVFQADGFSDNRRDRINIDPGAGGCPAHLVAVADSFRLAERCRSLPTMHHQLA